MVRLPRFRRFLAWLAFGATAASAMASTAPRFAVAPFTADVTIPIGHGAVAGQWRVTSVDDPLYAKGVVLLGAEEPIVFVSVDWCEIRNDAYDRWREVLAAAAKTTRERVLVSSVHQHEGPVADLTAQRMLIDRGLPGSICDLEFHEVAVQRVAGAMRVALRKAQRVTHLGIGQAKVEKVASNRRYLLPDGKVSHGRGSSSGANVIARDAPEGTIDPWLKTLTFWDGDRPVVALSAYATHPMSYYRTGEVSADFPGMARARRQKDTPDCLQIYVSGASGNVTAGKYNDGKRTNRAVLGDRLYAAMVEAWNATRRQSLTSMAFRSTEVRLVPREDAGFTEADLKKKLMAGVPERVQNLAALGLSWRQRAAAGHPIDVPVVDFGAAQLLLLPGEIYVEYQLAAQQMRPDAFVFVAGYGESATGYLPTEQAWAERDGNLNDWCWVAPGAEQPMLEAMRRVLVAESARSVERNRED